MAADTLALAQVGAAGAGQQLALAPPLQGVSLAAGQARAGRRVEARAAAGGAAAAPPAHPVVEEARGALVHAVALVQDQVKEALGAVGVALALAPAARGVAGHARAVRIHKEAQEALARAAPVVPELVRWAAQAFIFTASIASFAALVACIAISLGAKETLAALGVCHAACGVVPPVARYTRLAAGQGEALQARCPAAAAEAILATIVLGGAVGEALPVVGPELLGARDTVLSQGAEARLARVVAGVARSVLCGRVCSIGTGSDTRISEPEVVLLALCAV